MITMTSREAAAHFDELLDQVENGETVTITRDGRKVAVLSVSQSLANEKSHDPDEAERRAREWIAYRDRRKTSLGDLTIREAIEEGRM